MSEFANVEKMASLSVWLLISPYVSRQPFSSLHHITSATTLSRNLTESREDLCNRGKNPYLQYYEVNINLVSFYLSASFACRAYSPSVRRLCQPEVGGNDPNMEQSKSINRVFTW